MLVPLVCAWLSACSLRAAIPEGSAQPAHAPGGPPAAGSAGATVLPAGRVAARVVSLVAGAEGGVDLEMYELGAPQVLATLETAAMHEAVRVILDATERDTPAAAAALRRAGAQVVLAHVPGGIDHAKLLVVPGAVLVGGVNLGTGSSYTLDLDVEESAPATVRAARTLFAADWASFSRGGHGASSAPSPFLTGGQIASAFASTLASAPAASTCTVLANYLTDHSDRDELAAAARRGVVIDALLNPSAYGSAAAAAWLGSHGVHVRLAAPSPYLHAKVLACSSGALVGSANFSYAAATYNHEVDVVLSGPLAGGVASFAAAAFSGSA